MIINIAEENWKVDTNTKDLFLEFGDKKEKAMLSSYVADEDDRNVIAMVRNCFTWSDVIMRKPRREWNDMSTLARMMYDQMAFNIYQPNNGQPNEGDPTQSWKSNAMRPVVRNKVVSIAAHATAKLIFPKVFAYNEQSEEQEKAAMVMRDLIEWASEQNNYDKMSLHAVINACVNPASIMHVEYAEAYRTVKTDKDEKTGKWNTKEILDESNSGFILTPVPVDELYIADFYTEDIQKQEYLIWRRIQSYSMMKAKYGHYKNFDFVHAGVQVIYNDANTSFYEVYDSNLRQTLCEEIIFYSESLDLKIVLVNGVLLTDRDEPNPRLDKKYPFIKFYYEPLDEGRCFYGKSLAFKMQPDADIINTLYPMIIDGTYLNIFNPLIISGEEEIGSEVMIPGTTTTLINPESSVVPLRVAQDIRQGMETLQKVEESLDKSSEQPLDVGSRATAYQISKVDAEKQTILGMFVKMISDYVRQYGSLIKSDICQYITLPEVDKIIDDGELIYKSIIVHDKQTDTGKVNRRIKFDLTSPSKDLTDDEELGYSYDILEEQGGEDTKQEICRVNPVLFRKLKYMVCISPDVMAPMSDDLERAYGLELFDRAIQAPKLGVPVDMDQVFKDFLFKLYPKSAKNVNKYFKKEKLANPLGDPNLPAMNQAQPTPATPPAAGASNPGMTSGPGMPNTSSMGPLMK
jgi:hypothetical protein